jgi:hypothetical protein
MPMGSAGHSLGGIGRSHARRTTAQPVGTTWTAFARQCSTWSLTRRFHYGAEWYGYLMRRLARRPQNLSFFLRSLISKK